ncbi:Ubiquitin-like protein 4A [Holothuria leucospilota]|uniref:Ubiquitin-like protein 4A n=1 Tax=Holothuria leucospilota TaxID=206669 RepID=A0A9Q1CKI4_HOLLE|nr:Ubiquitin-like protein 4A [Holothuria leucospilota]
MILTVKILQTPSKECRIEVTASEPVISVKRMVARELDVPVHLQRLVFKGKTLADGQCLCDYNIGPGTKIHLVVRRPEFDADSLSPACLGRSTVLWDKLQEMLHRHFEPGDAEIVLENFKKEFSTSVTSLSWDDIERLAINKLGATPNPNQPGPST